MNIHEVNPEQEILILIDEKGNAFLHTKEEIDILIKSEAIHEGYYLIKAHVTSVFKARKSIELKNVHIK